MNLALSGSYRTNKLYKTLNLEGCSSADICTKLCNIYDSFGWDMAMKAAYLHWGIPRSEFRAPLIQTEDKTPEQTAHDRIKVIVDDSFHTWELSHHK